MHFHRWTRGLAAAFGLLLSLCAANAATLMPNGKQQFISGNGVPLSGGFVYMYSPSTTNCKNTWQDAAQTILNACPIVLDANGEAIIYGTGTYSQEVRDSLNNVIYNQFTTDTSASNSVFWSGTAGGTPNAITVVDANFNGTDGVVVQFVALATNTSATTINPSAFGNITVVKDTTSGPVALSGSEIIAGNVISVVYSASGNQFHLLNAVIASASGTTGPLCGATGLKITNNGGTPNSIINLTADSVVMNTTAGIPINRSNVSLTAINITQGNATAAANGMDGESPGTSAWLSVFAIDNGSAPAGLVSLTGGNGSSPNMPSGYTYKCLLGFVQVDSSGNLFRTLQLGNEMQYVVVAGVANNSTMQKVSNGLVGTYSRTSGAGVGYTSQTILANSGTTAFCPALPFTTKVGFMLMNEYNNAALAQMSLAPNTSYSAIATTNPPPLAIDIGGANYAEAKIGWLVPEANTFQYMSVGAGAGEFVLGCKFKVNAS